VSSEFSLPGLERLLEVIKHHELNAHIWPAGHSPPRAGEKLAGRIVDPLLAAVYTRLGGMAFRPWHHLMLRCDDEINGLLLENQQWDSFWPHPVWPEHFRTLMLFGTDMGYRYATVPEMANSKGLQPVLYLDNYEDIYALPVASDVDQFFLTYSKYLELVVNEPDFKERHVPSMSFPWDVPGLFAGDAPLVEMIRAGKFDRWMTHGTTASSEMRREWAVKVQSVRHEQYKTE
jgi:hypothetical protein